MTSASSPATIALDHPGAGDWISWIRPKVGNELIFVTSACGCIRDAQGRVLMQKRRGDQDIWGFPGGIMELGESAADTAAREVLEETGLATVATRLIGVYTKFFETCPNGDRCQTVSFFFEMQVLSGALTIDGHETHALKFCGPDEKPNLYTDQHELMWKDLWDGGDAFFR